MYYTECPKCGANLDPGEKCDCQQEQICPSCHTLYKWVDNKQHEPYAYCPRCHSKIENASPAATDEA